MESRARSVLVGFALLSAVLALGAGSKEVWYDTIDPDCFIHLVAAEQRTTDGIGPIFDRTSFASIQEPWPPYSWLAQLAMKALWDRGGYRAAVAAHAIHA